MARDLIRAVIDTNVWVSALINPFGLPSRIVQAFRAQQFVPIASPLLVDEIREVVQRPRVRRKIALREEDVAQLLLPTSLSKIDHIVLAHNVLRI